MQHRWTFEWRLHNFFSIRFSLFFHQISSGQNATLIDHYTTSSLYRQFELKWVSFCRNYFLVDCLLIFRGVSRKTIGNEQRSGLFCASTQFISKASSTGWLNWLNLVISSEIFHLLLCLDKSRLEKFAVCSRCGVCNKIDKTLNKK